MVRPSAAARYSTRVARPVASPRLHVDLLHVGGPRRVLLEVGRDPEAHRRRRRHDDLLVRLLRHGAARYLRVGGSRGGNVPSRAAHTPARPTGNIGTNTPNGAHTTVAHAITKHTPNIARNCNWTARGAEPCRKNKFSTATLSPFGAPCRGQDERVRERADGDEEQRERDHDRRSLERFDPGRRRHRGHEEQPVRRPSRTRSRPAPPRRSSQRVERAEVAAGNRRELASPVARRRTRRRPAPALRSPAVARPPGSSSQDASAARTSRGSRPSTTEPVTPSSTASWEPPLARRRRARRRRRLPGTRSRTPPPPGRPTDRGTASRTRRRTRRATAGRPRRPARGGGPGRRTPRDAARASNRRAVAARAPDREVHAGQTLRPRR